MDVQPLLTIGMAHYQDFAGLWATIQSIRLNNLHLMDRVQFVVINNSPENHETADAIRGLLAKTKRRDHAWEPGYYELDNIQGTSASRDAIFKHARGKYVAVMDCHLEFAPGWLQRLLDYYKQHPETSDLISGTLIDDSLDTFSTHFRDTWGGAMWGRWAQAWRCQCGKTGSYFDMEQVRMPSGSELAMPRRLQLGNVPIEACEACGKSIPDLTWAGHEAKLMGKGFAPAGVNANDEPFEIPGQGLGFFSCRRDAWLGFNPHAKAFGGEELYIHEKFRRAGRRALCVPGMLWNHRFYREGGAKYPNTNFDKVRNLVLEFNEVGLPLDPIKTHFVDTPIPEHLAEKPPRTLFYLSSDAWEAIVADPINTTEDPGPRKLAAAQAAALLPHLTTIDELFAEVEPIPRDLNEHMHAFRLLAQQAAGTVVEITARRESTIGFLAGRPQVMIAFTSEADTHVMKAGSLVADTTKFTPRKYVHPHIIADLPENDLLFIDTKHTAEHLTEELNTYAPRCRRFIVLHDTETFGERGENGSLGLRFAIADFCDAHPQWAVIDHTKDQHGLTVLSCQIEDRPETPVEGFNVPRGPGTELKKILASLGIAPSAVCTCNAKAAQMDIWGIEGCRLPDNYAVIVQWMKDGAWSELGTTIAGAIGRSFFTGIAWQLNPLNPFGSLVDLCLKRAEETEAKRAQRGTRDNSGTVSESL